MQKSQTETQDGMNRSTIDHGALYTQHPSFQIVEESRMSHGPDGTVQVSGWGQQQQR
jgi:hypothetical protein